MFIFSWPLWVSKMKVCEFVSLAMKSDLLQKQMVFYVKWDDMNEFAFDSANKNKSTQRTRSPSAHFYDYFCVQIQTNVNARTRTTIITRQNFDIKICKYLAHTMKIDWPKKTNKQKCTRPKTGRWSHWATFTPVLCPWMKCECMNGTSNRCLICKYVCMLVCSFVQSICPFWICDIVYNPDAFDFDMRGDRVCVFW